MSRKQSRTKRCRWLAGCCAVSWLIAGSVLHAVEPTRAQLDHFENHIRPVLASQCLKCHGEHKQESGLRLDSFEAASFGGDSGAAIVPGEPGESLLLEAIRHETFEMPPDDKLEDESIEQFVKWIEMGAAWPRFDGKSETIRLAGREISQEDRDYWAYQPVVRPEVPQSASDAWSRSPIDRFIFRKLHEVGLAPADEADRRTLIRRATYDLTGLPPTWEEVRAFVDDPDPHAYEKLIDRLLSSPRYGEHWASYWLDLVRYAESDGFRQDALRGQAWKYRDYVIRAFNDDKPYDQFVREQLAGDEIAPGDSEALTATMFLKHGIYEYNQRDIETQRLDMLNDITDVTGDVFLASGMGCARCHDHKFDPLLQKDYYRLQAFFTPLAFDHDGTLAERGQRQIYESELAKWSAATEELRRQLWEIEQPVLARTAGGQGISKFDPSIQKLILMWPGDRTPHQQQVVELTERQLDYKRDALAKQIPEKLQQRWRELTAELVEFEVQKPQPLPRVSFVAADVGREPPQTYIPGAPDEPIAPGFLSVIDPSPAEIPQLPEYLPSTGRRTVLANWIASEDNPLSTRVIVNRLWQYHFGRGIAVSSSDFGHLGEKPTHPELLDWLTSDFIEEGWKIKRMHRLIMTSATYRQSALVDPTPTALEVDPQNELYWRARIRRPQAEAIRDSMLAVSGELVHDLGGNPVGGNSARRSVYLQVRRNAPNSFLSAFDFPDRISSMATRNVTTTPVQSLLVANSDWMLKRATAFAKQLEQEQTETVDDLIKLAYARAYQRRPSESETHAAQAFLRQQEELVELVAKQHPEDKLARGTEISSPRQVITIEPENALPTEDFTVEAVIVLRSLFSDASVRTIASQWNNNTKRPGWAFGVTSEKSRYTPRNLILQLVGESDEGKQTYEVIPSNILLELDRPYYVAVSVKIDDPSERGITFFMKDLSKPDNKLQVANVSHQVLGNYQSNLPLVIGGRDHEQRRHHWDGWIDDLRLSKNALAADALLINQDKPQDDPMFFDLENLEPKVPLKHIVDRKDLVDFCHTLLSSNEFLYVD